MLLFIIKFFYNKDRTWIYDLIKVIYIYRYIYTFNFEIEKKIFFSYVLDGIHGKGII